MSKEAEPRKDLPVLLPRTCQVCPLAEVCAPHPGDGSNTGPGNYGKRGSDECINLVFDLQENNRLPNTDAVADDRQPIQPYRRPPGMFGDTPRPTSRRG